MDPAPVSQRVESEKKWCVDDKAQQHPPSSFEVVSKVLDDENLLIEILLHVGFPTTLVHAALVCRRWLHHASKPAFLSSFRKLHPPHLLGFYVDVSVPLREIPPLFVQFLPQPPELAVVVCHLDTYEKEDRNIHDLDEWSGPELINGFWNGKFTNRGMVGVPPSSPHNELKSGQCSLFRDLLSKEKGHGLLYVWSSINADHNKGRGKLTMNLYKFENGFWHMHTSVTPELTYRKVDEEPLLVKSKVYMRRFIEGDILVWDFMASSFFTIQLPEGVEYLDRNTMLSLADDTEFYLLHLNNVQLRIWLYSGDNWLLMDTICLSRFYAILGVSDAMAADEYNAIIRIGDGGNKVEYVFLRIGQCALHLDIKHRVLRKVYELTEAGGFLWDVHPLMMIWPPAFPSLKDDTSRMPCEEQGYEKALG